MIYSFKFDRNADDGVLVNSDMSDDMSAAVHQSMSVFVGVLGLKNQWTSTLLIFKESSIDTDTLEIGV